MMNYLKNQFFEVTGDVDNDKLLKIISIRYNIYLHSGQKYITTTVAQDVSKETMVAIQENASTLKGVKAEEQNIRKYNDSLYYAPILGYTGTISETQLEEFNAQGKNYISSDVVGKAGLESAYEDYLQGTRGEQKVFIDSTGKVLSTVSEKDSTEGNDVYMTIDSKLQKATYKLLEKKIASILISEIVNYDVNEDAETDDDIHYIPVKKVYSQLVANNVVSLKKLSRKSATANEKKVNKEYKKAVSDVVKVIKSQLNSDKGKVYNDAGKEYQEYYDYIYDLLKNDGILLTSSIDTKDKTYNNYVDGKISINEFIKYSIKKNWINIEGLHVSDAYLSADETYNLLKDYIVEDMSSNTSFGKKVMYYRIYDGTIHSSEILMLLFDQNILQEDEQAYSQLQTYNSTYNYSFIIKQIKKLNITPAQIALDPCSGTIVVTDPNNGQIRALVTYPSYDNNMLSGTVDPDYWQQLVEDQSDPLYNRATQGATAPGSTFKMTTTMAAMENDVVGQYETVVDKGKFEKVTPSPKCWIYPSAHGAENVMNAIADSCNYFFYEMGYRLGTVNGKYDSATGLKKIEPYATKLGLNMKSECRNHRKRTIFSESAYSFRW